MKRICILTIGLFLMIGVLNAFAAGENQGIINTTQNTTFTVQTFYDPFGVAYRSITDTTTITTTVRRDEDGKLITSTSTTTQTTVSTWKGGGLKADYAEGNTHTEADDGSSSDTKFRTDYKYDENGRLADAYGKAVTTGINPEDTNEEGSGTYKQVTTYNYDIRNGQALLTSSVTTGKEWGPDSALIRTSTATTNYDYALIAGSWVLMSTTSVQDTTGQGSKTGESSHIVTTTTYQRDSNGLCTGISRNMTGTQTTTNDAGGSTTFRISNYEYRAAFDPNQGWYIAWDNITWEQVSRREPRREKDPAISGKIIFVNGELYMVVESIKDHDGEYDGEGRIVKLEAAEGQEAEFEALKALVQSNGGSLEDYTIWGDYVGEGAEDYTSHSFVFHGIGFGPFGD